MSCSDTPEKARNTVELSMMARLSASASIIQSTARTSLLEMSLVSAWCKRAHESIASSGTQMIRLTTRDGLALAHSSIERKYSVACGSLNREGNARDRATLLLVPPGYGSGVPTGTRRRAPRR